MKHLFTYLLIFLSCNATNAQDKTVIETSEITFFYHSHKVNGSLGGFTSDSHIDLDNPVNSTFQGAVATETLKTGNFLRDWSLKGGRYFDIDTYPEITFVSSVVSPTKDGFSVQGDLTIKDVTRPIAIAFKRDGRTLTGTTTLLSSDYGINVKKKPEENKVTVTMVFTLK
tara:strand:+ start:3448 stop:3957 length:510 start_codon:yes stop_codon:yes gene_type:complete